MASIQVRPTLLNGSCSVSDHPEVCECVRSASDFGFFGLNCFTILAHSIRAARILAISMKWFIPIAQKNDRRGAKASMSMPAATPRTKVFQSIGQCISQFNVGGGTRFPACGIPK